MQLALDLSCLSAAMSDWSPIHKHCRKTCRKTRHKIIITYHLRCHKIILRHVVNKFTEFIFNDRNFFYKGVLLSW